ncbi:hypothetical protein LSH36_74g11125 [Paralvinella palmiformis]|uniref:Protein FAM136A n=1 Tax=Paralvinella palmiformis TaxID=53620 RepID=A0AAD9K480_9ANNE|nr:hypothetical protein LSH36_74g11125 [Paralvinella palmiformis]
MEGANARVQEAVTKLGSNLDREYLRKMQAVMYRCMAVCCENEHYNMDDTQRCLDKCSGPARKAEQYISSELDRWQQRLQRCSIECNDKVRDKVTPQTSESDIAKYRKEYETCALKCVDTHINLLPDIEKKMKGVLKEASSK